MIVFSKDFFDVQLLTILCCSNFNHKGAVLQKCPVGDLQMKQAQIRYTYTYTIVSCAHVHTYTHGPQITLFIATCTVTIPATSQLLTFDMASFGLLLTCALSLRELKFVQKHSI